MGKRRVKREGGDGSIVERVWERRWVGDLNGVIGEVVRGEG